MKKSKAAIDLAVKPSVKEFFEEHWERVVPASAEGFGDDPAGAFLPRPGRNRAQPHEKINECDH